MSSLLAGLLAAGLSAAEGGRAAPGKEERVMHWTGAFCGVEEPSHRLVETRAQWKALWKALGKAAPEADLEAHFAVAVFLGARPTGGFSVRFEEPRRSGKRLVVAYRVVPPSGMAFQALTQPYAVRLFPRSPGPVSVEALP